ERPIGFPDRDAAGLELARHLPLGGQLVSGHEPAFGDLLLDPVNDCFRHSGLPAHACWHASILRNAARPVNSALSRHLRRPPAKGRTIALRGEGMAHYGGAERAAMSQLATSIHPNAARSPAAPLSPPPAIGTRSVVVLAALAIAAAGFRLLPLGIDPQAHPALAVGIFMSGCWMTQVLDHGIAGILGCFLFWMLGVARFETAFSGFADSTPWFLFGAICCGLMGSKSGLARRLAYLVMRRIGSSYPRLLLGLIVSNFLLTAVVPSGIARVVMMAAIAVGLIEAFGVDRTSNIA